MDALFSMAQIPSGVPVGFVAIGKSGAKNAVFLALRILGINNDSIAEKLENYKQKQRQEILSIDLDKK